MRTLTAASSCRSSATTTRPSPSPTLTTPIAVKSPTTAWVTASASDRVTRSSPTAPTMSTSMGRWWRSGIEPC
eukprot:1653935-Pyramimonas_sp.AAC.1